MSNCLDCKWWDRWHRVEKTKDHPAICQNPNANPKDFYCAPHHVCSFFELFDNERWNTCRTCIYWDIGNRGDRFPNAAACLCPLSIVSNTGPNFWCCNFKNASISKKDKRAWPLLNEDLIDGPTERLLNHLQEISCRLNKIERKLNDVWDEVFVHPEE